MSNGNFANGLIVKKAHQNAPAFVKCSLSFKVDEFIQCLQQNNNNGWVNMDIKLAQDNVKLYAQIDNWQPNQQQAPPQQQQPQQNQGYQQQAGQYQESMILPATTQQPPQNQQQYGNQAPQQNQPPKQQIQQDGGYAMPTDDIPFSPCE